MHYAARAIQDRRGSTYESSYAQAFTDPNNVGIKSGMMAEQESPKSLTMEEALSPEVRPLAPYEGPRPVAGTSDVADGEGHVGARPADSVTAPRPRVAAKAAQPPAHFEPVPGAHAIGDHGFIWRVI